GRDPAGDHVGPAQIREHPAEGGGARHRGQWYRVQHARVDEVAGQLADVLALQQGNQNRHDIDDGHHPGFGRREPAREDAAHDDDRDDEGQRRPARGRPDLRQCRARSLHADGPEEMAVDHEPDADENAGHHAAQEEAPDGHASGSAPRRSETPADVISPPTRRKTATATGASESMPWNIRPMLDAKLTGVRAVAPRTPAISAKATGTPR